MTAVSPIRRHRLRELENEVTRQGSPFAATAAPPVEPSRLREAERRVGRTFPDELRAWWLWHDGSRARPGESSAHVLGVGAFEPYSLDRALSEWDEWSRRSIFREQSDSRWKFLESWLPFAGAASYKRLNAKLELSSPERLTLGLVEIEWAPREFGRTVDQTMSELISGWISYLRAGRTRWVPEVGAWSETLPRPAGYDVDLFGN